jgi:hypothetical protein
VGPQARDEYLAQMRDRYLRASRREKGRMLTEAVTVTSYHRKAIIRAWRRPAERLGRGPRRGRPTRYDAAVVRALLHAVGTSLDDHDAERENAQVVLVLKLAVHGHERVDLSRRTPEKLSVLDPGPT